MIQPEIFTPKSTLELPVGEPTEVHLAIIEETNLLTMPMGAAALLHRHMDCAPEWREWPDGKGGNMHVVSREGDVPLASFSGLASNRNLVTPYNTDGYTIHNDEKVIIAYGASFPDHLSVLWGVSTQPLTELLITPDDIRLNLIFTDHPRSVFRARLNSATPEERSEILSNARSKNYND